MTGYGAILQSGNLSHAADSIELMLDEMVFECALLG